MTIAGVKATAETCVSAPSSSSSAASSRGSSRIARSLSASPTASSSVAFDAGPVQDAAKMGALFSFAAAIISIIAGKVTRVQKVSN